MSQCEILILEDNAARQFAMRARLMDRFPQYPVCCSHEPARFLDHISHAAAQPLLISLDHDLDPIPRSDGSLYEPGKGQTVVDWLANRPPVCPVIIHSTNVPAARNMQHQLHEAGWTVHRLTPYDDLAWIDGAWFTAARDLLLSTAIPAESSIHAHAATSNIS